jgi:hypothetical protein
MAGRLSLARVLGGMLLLFGALAPIPAASQLISPGKLSSVHSDLEGIRNCTQCHELHKPGISARLCLACHEPLARRIEAKAGFHGGLPDPEACARCHKEHFGVDFELVRLDSVRFNHRLTGFALEGRHADGECRDCHKPALVTDKEVRTFKAEHGALDRTFLGLPTECASCHADDSPHGAQFKGRACTSCHDVRGWKDAREFDHAKARFHLTGKHRDLECSKCHAATPRAGSDVPFVRYRPVRFARCNDCHEDPHHGSMKGACSSCHRTGGWAQVNRERVASTFDHGTTGFTLEGSHAGADCSSCHDARAAQKLDGIRIRFEKGTASHPFPRPESAKCLSCHEDPHGGIFSSEPDGGDCRGCHGQDEWTPARYDAARHDRETSFKLEGAHLTVACRDCHTEKKENGTPVFRLKSSSCVDCHQQTNPHGDQFKGRSCADCHTVETFHIAHFDHDATRFRLEGAHARATCGECHKKETNAAGVTMVRYRPLGTECRDCHGGAS